MLTVKQIIKKLKGLQIQHQQLNSFHFGPKSELSASEAPMYPLMGVDFLPGTLGNKSDNIKMLLFFGDLVHKDNSNRIEVLSDTREIAKGIFSQFKNWLYVNGIELTTDAPFSDFIESWNDEVSGWQLEVTINLFFSSDFCQEPVNNYLQTVLGDYITLVNGDYITLN